MRDETGMPPEAGCHRAAPATTPRTRTVAAAMAMLWAAATLGGCGASNDGATGPGWPGEPGWQAAAYEPGAGRGDGVDGGARGEGSAGDGGRDRDRAADPPLTDDGTLASRMAADVAYLEGHFSGDDRATLLDRDPHVAGASESDRTSRPRNASDASGDSARRRDAGSPTTPRDPGRRSTGERTALADPYAAPSLDDPAPAADAATSARPTTPGSARGSAPADGTPRESAVDTIVFNVGGPARRSSDAPDRVADPTPSSAGDDWRLNPFDARPLATADAVLDGIGGPGGLGGLDGTDPDALGSPAARTSFDASTDDAARDDPMRSDAAAPPAGSHAVRQHLAPLRRALLDEAIAAPDETMLERVALALTLLVDPDAEIEPILGRELDPEQEDVASAFATFARDASVALRGLEDRDALIAAVDRLRDRLAETPILELPTALLCTQVEGFGEYERIRQPAFVAGRTNPVIVYVEVDAFTSERDERGTWVTELSQRLAIYREGERTPVWTGPWQEFVDEIPVRRRDFFVAQIVELPASLSLGGYTMKIRMRDDRTGAEADASIPFRITADGRPIGTSTTP